LQWKRQTFVQFFPARQGWHLSKHQASVSMASPDNVGRFMLNSFALTYLLHLQVENWGDIFLRNVRNYLKTTRCHSCEDNSRLSAYEYCSLDSLCEHMKWMSR
jgi:hypothetical protein